METMRVLVVDDEADFLHSVVKRLNLRKIQADGVESGGAALKYLSEQAADVVVLDVKMPDKSGLVVLEEIKRRHPGVEVIILTGHTAVDANIEGVNLGAFDYLIKPVRIEALLEKIKAAYAKKTGA